MADILARNKSSPGQSLTELAIALPLLIIILVGVIDLGRLYYSYITVFNAAREGARYGSSHPTDTAGITTHARQEANGSAVNPADLQITPSCLGSCNPGNPIQIIVQYNNFQLISAYLFGGGSIPMQASQQMVIYGQ